MSISSIIPRKWFCVKILGIEMFYDHYIEFLLIQKLSYF